MNKKAKRDRELRRIKDDSRRVETILKDLSRQRRVERNRRRRQGRQQYLKHKQSKED